MNILANYRYQMVDHKKSILIFYLVLVILDLVAAISITAVNTNTSVTSNGGEFITLVFLFVASLCSFKETFLLSLQNGSSRKTLFTARLLTTLSIAIIMSIADRIHILLDKGIMALCGQPFKAFSLFATIYEYNQHPVILELQSFFLEIVLALGVMAIGYFITILFYRLNKTGKILVGAGVPIGLLFVFPYLDVQFLGGRLSKLLAHMLLYAVTPPLHLVLSSLIVFILFSVLSYLLMRKAVIKK